jgi:hypothetical protein
MSAGHQASCTCRLLSKHSATPPRQQLQEIDLYVTVFHLAVCKRRQDAACRDALN